MKEKIDFCSKVVICILGAVLFGYIFLRRIILLILPFLIAWGMAFIVRPPAHYLAARLRISERILRVLLSLAFTLSGVSLIAFFIWKLLVQLWRILTALGERGELTSVIERVMNPGSMLSRVLPSGISDLITEALDGALESLSTSFATFAARFVSAVPSFFLFVVVSLIAEVYFALDLERVNAFVKSKLPEKAAHALVRFKNGFFGVGIKYARSYVVIMLITFAIVFTGLLLLGVEYAFLISVLISVLDVLPVIGIGTVLVPWAVFQIAFGSRALGVGLVVLFLIAEFIRQLIEPKIVGKNLGLDPIVSLILLYGSYSLFGLVGILFIPCAVVVINALFGKDDAAKVGKRRVGKRDKA